MEALIVVGVMTVVLWFGLPLFWALGGVIVIGTVPLLISARG